MVNKKYRLYSSIFALCMTLVLMATGVWAILQQSLGVSTTVTFTATSVKGTINGEVEGGYAGITTDYETTALGGSAALTGAEIVKFGPKYVFANITGTNSSWNGKEAYCINEGTTEKVGAEVSSATIALATTSYTVSNKSYISNFSPTNSSTDWTIGDMSFQPNAEGQTSAITITLTIENTGSNIIAVSFPDDNNQWSDSMSETTAPNDNLLVSYSTSNNGSAYSEPEAFSTIGTKSIVTGGITSIKISVTVQDESSSISAIILAFQVKLEKGADVWGGETALSFAGGYGTEIDPYEIENGEQLAYLSTLPAGTYYELTNDIILNNATFMFNEDSGLVEVKNRERTIYLGMSIEPASATTFSTGTKGVAGTVYTLVGETYTAWTTVTADTGLIAVGADLYLGTGTVGDTSSTNTQFDSTASVHGQFYTLDGGTYTSSFLNVWTPIGNSTTQFSAKTFNGNGHEVTGIYVNSSANNKGLFGYALNSTIQNIGVVNSFINGSGVVGGVVGYNVTSTVNNSYNTGFVTGISNTGGIVGYSQTTSIISNTYNTGVICNTSGMTGGIVGYNEASTISESYNAGMLKCVGITNIGGIVAYNANGTLSNLFNTGSITGSGNLGGVVGYSASGGTLINSFNTGDINGTDSYVGGVAGLSNTCSLTNCYNTGDVNGTTNVGGLVGRILNTVSNCYNMGTVIGLYSNVGGLVGVIDGATISESYNRGYVEGRENVGGIAGYTNESINNCYNTGNVVGTNGGSVGGVAGTGSACTVRNVFNTGSVTATGNYVGGVLGANQSSSNVYNSFNTGNVTGANLVGGVIGLNDGGSVNNTYNIGTISGTGGYVGSLLGVNSNSAITYSYYLVSTTPIGLNSGGTSANLSDFDSGDQILNSAVTIGTTYQANTTHLVDILNAWVTTNQTTPAYKNWTCVGSTNGYPIFA